MAGSALRVLVIEDHFALGRCIAAVLAASGCEVIGPFGEHAAALDAVRRGGFDVAVLDRMLRGEETFVVVDAVRARGMRCVLISGYPHSTLPVSLHDLPFLQKPFTMAALVAAVQDAATGPR